MRLIACSCPGELGGAAPFPQTSPFLLEFVVPLFLSQGHLLAPCSRWAASECVAGVCRGGRAFAGASFRPAAAGVVPAVLLNDSPDDGAVDPGQLLCLEVTNTQVAHRLDTFEQRQVFFLLDILPLIRAVVAWLAGWRLFTLRAVRDLKRPQVAHRSTAALELV